MSLAVTFFLMFLHHGSRGYFFGPVPVPAGALSAFLDMLVFPLLFCADATKMFFSRHEFLFFSLSDFLTDYCVSFCFLSHHRSLGRQPAIL
jgi:hypothetical protein